MPVLFFNDSPPQHPMASATAGTLSLLSQMKVKQALNLCLLCAYALHFLPTLFVVMLLFHLFFWYRKLIINNTLQAQNTVIYYIMHGVSLTFYGVNNVTETVGKGENVNM